MGTRLLSVVERCLLLGGPLTADKLQTIHTHTDALHIWLNIHTHTYHNRMQNAAVKGTLARYSIYGVTICNDIHNNISSGKGSPLSPVLSSFLFLHHEVDVTPSRYCLSKVGLQGSP